MEQRQRFVSVAGSGHFTVTELCREFGVSRKTGHKWLGRHAQGGMKALADRSRAPLSVACRTPVAVERLIVAEKRLHPTWGPKQIRRVLETKHGVENPPVASTVGEVLKRHVDGRPTPPARRSLPGRARCANCSGTLQSRAWRGFQGSV